MAINGWHNRYIAVTDRAAGPWPRILVWHFYFVIFDPLVYPMDTAWLTGREVPGRTLERTEAVTND